MKGGVAVMVELARWAATSRARRRRRRSSSSRARSSPREYSPLPALFDTSRSSHEAELGVVLEPTDNAIQAGCVGNLNARRHFHGVSGALGAALARRERDRPGASTGSPGRWRSSRREVESTACSFREVISVTRIEGGIADNVVPDRAEATSTSATRRTGRPSEAEARLRELVPTGADVELIGDSPPAHGRRATRRSSQRLRAAGDFAIEPKQAWTPVAEFTERGIDAVNFGPGATRFAHTRDEQVEIAALERAYESAAPASLAAASVQAVHALPRPRRDRPPTPSCGSTRRPQRRAARRVSS